MRSIAILGLLALACGGDDGGGGGFDAAPSGRACFSGAGEDDPTLLASPSADCPSRMCLHVQGEPVDQCTAFCEDAADCAAAAETPCDGSFVCEPVIDEGPYRCRKVCVCDSTVPEGGFPVSCAR
ncbi:MAG TPA: hypothetical protein VFT95_08915 [Micromonosporaceae bacterium]|nr:hypothetical protein [Micromonosporaceae bacterium]